MDRKKKSPYTGLTKAHSNDEKLSPEEAMLRLMFASMLMHKIDEAVIYSGVAE